MKKNSLSYGWLRVTMAVSLVIILIISLIPVMPIKVIPASAPQTEFSAERAMSDLKVITAEPHSMGSAAQKEVTKYLLAQIRTSGVTPEAPPQAGPKNIVVIFPGSDPTGKVLITGHYDSHFDAQGAGDDGVSTVAMLEAIRVLQTEEKLKNDIVFLFTDGEESGMLGSAEFLKTPLAKQISVVLAFDAWPGHAPTTFQTSSKGDEWLIRNLAQVDPPIYAMSYQLKKVRATLDSDFDVLKGQMSGMEFENNGTGTRYHTLKDTVDGVDPSLVQSQGETMLLLAHHFGSLDLSSAYQGDDYSFFTLPLIGIVAFPYWVNLLVSGIAIVVLLAVIIVGWLRGRRIKPVRTLVSSVIYSILFYGLVMISSTLWDQVVKTHPESAGLAFPDFSGSGWVLLGFMLVAGIIFITLMALLSHYTGVPSMAAGALIAWLAFGFYLFSPSAFNFGNPLMLEFTAWSFLGGACGLAVATFVLKPGRKVLLLALAAIPVIFMFAPLMVLSMLKPQDGAMASNMLLIYSMGLLLPQFLFVVRRQETPLPTAPEN
jgi:Peptidase family M28